MSSASNNSKKKSEQGPGSSNNSQSSLRGDLKRLAEASPQGQVPAASLPAGWAPSVSYDPSGRADVVTLGVGDPGDETSWTEEVRALGVAIPDGWSARLVEVRHDPRAWVRHSQGEQATTEPVTRRRYVVEPTRKILDIDELVKSIGGKRPKPPVTPAGSEGMAYVHTVADWQISKTAYGQGTEQTVERILGALDRSVERIKKERRRTPITTIVIAALGDLCEGVVSQGGAVRMTTDLSFTAELRVIRRLLLEHVKAFAPLAERIILPSAPGNHDQAHRIAGMSAPATDSFAVDAAMQVADALHLAGGYDHVQIVTPDEDDLTVTIEAEGTIIGTAHGHQFRQGKGHEWWAKMGHSRHRIGAAHLLLSGHYHHFRAIDDAGGRTWIQCPTVDPGSPWFDQRHGGGARAGVLTLLTRDGKWTGLEIL